MGSLTKYTEENPPTVAVLPATPAVFRDRAFWDIFYSRLSYLRASLLHLRLFLDLFVYIHCFHPWASFFPPLALDVF